MTLEDLLMALRFLGVEEAEGDGSGIREIYIYPGAMRVITLSLDEEGRPFVDKDDELATDVKIYPIGTKR